ncbi:UDP-N-acetylglucosamine 2-epimerase (non-hydrolyzing) [bacterium]|jgi:UDP-N-acetylglucosamine 2-epimerase (non-hydrolysing)|nr:UDP-N-acetylglucosamine 2-epimerase (non-hydrolyzing) [bacterium]
MKKNPIVLITGARPGGIKIAPVYLAFKKAAVPIVLCSTAQHRSLLDDVFGVFDIKPDIDLNVMKKNQDLFHVTQEVLIKTKEVFKKINPPLVFVQGDTTTLLGATLSAFYLSIPIAHMEAGLRTGNIKNPFPEEFNRRTTSSVADLNFAPTQQAVENLLKEGVSSKKIFCTGNSIVDALRIIKDKIQSGEIIIDENIKKKVEEIKNNKKKLVVLTAHRRESLNGGIERILKAVKSFACAHPEVVFFYPRHPNPSITKIINAAKINDIPNILIAPPVSYPEMVYLLSNSSWVATDSGGIQEEAVSLGKQTIVLRENTERPEGIWVGLASLVGTNENKIIDAMNKIYADENKKSSDLINIYGDGFAAEKMVSICKKFVENL